MPALKWQVLPNAFGNFAKDFPPDRKRLPQRSLGIGRQLIHAGNWGRAWLD